MIQGRWVRGTAQWYVAVCGEHTAGTVVELRSPEGKQTAYRVLTREFGKARGWNEWLWHTRAAEPAEVLNG